MPELKAGVHSSDPQITGRAAIKDMSLYLEIDLSSFI